MLPNISITNLSKTYGARFQALKRVNLDIRRGEIFKRIPFTLQHSRHDERGWHKTRDEVAARIGGVAPLSVFAAFRAFAQECLEDAVGHLDGFDVRGIGWRSFSLISVLTTHDYPANDCAVATLVRILEFSAGIRIFGEWVEADGEGLLRSLVASLA